MGREASAGEPDRWISAPAHQPRPQPLPALRQPPLNRSDRQSELPRGLFVAQTFEVAQHDRRPISLRQPVQLLVKLWQEARGATLLGSRFHLPSSTLDCAQPGRLGL